MNLENKIDELSYNWDECRQIASSILSELRNQEKAVNILISVAKALLYEVDGGGDLGYHLDVPEYAGRLREALELLGIELPKEWQDWEDWKGR